MNDSASSRKIWFPAKTYGWGWGLPICWQGWVATIAYMISLAGCSILLRDRAHLLARMGCIIGLSLVFVAICWYKGETPRWRWGGPTGKGPEA